MSLSHLLGQGVLRVTGAASPSWWDPSGEGLSVWGAWQAKGAVDYATSLTDLSGNGNNLVRVGNDPLWNVATGWSDFLGQSAALETSFVPQNDQSQTMIVQYAGNPAASNVNTLAGAYTAANRAFRLRARSAANVIIYDNGALQAGAAWLVAGNLAVSGSQGYRNGVADGGAIGAWGGASTFSVWIGALNFAGVALGYFDKEIHAVAIYDVAITAPQVLAVATAMAAL